MFSIFTPGRCRIKRVKDIHSDVIELSYTPERDSIRRQDTISTSIDPESPELCRDDRGKSRPGVYVYCGNDQTSSETPSTLKNSGLGKTSITGGTRLSRTTMRVMFEN